MLVKVQKQFTESARPAKATVLMGPATIVSTMPIDMWPTWLSTIGPASLSVSLSSARKEIAARALAWNEGGGSRVMGGCSRNLRFDTWFSFSRVKLVSWNVNGLRAVLRKNFLDFLAEENPDILCLQENKAGPHDVEQLWPARYTTYWNVALKKGYSGTAMFTKKRPLEIQGGIGKAVHDKEGRVL